MTTIYQETAGRLKIGTKDFSLDDLVMEYHTSLAGDTLITIKSKVHPTGVENALLSTLQDNVGGTYANVADWLVWWEALSMGPDVSVTSTALPTGAATSAKQDTIIADLADLETDVEAVKTAVDSLKTEQFPEKIYILAGTGAAATDTYLGFYAIEVDTAIDSITGIDTDLVKGDNDFSEVTFQPGTFVRVPGGFTTMTLSAGAMVLVIDNS